ncbi:hypothetical protein N9W44_05835 [Alphaproteobacteria bacterium]|nr:hypothetical protein [Alphaproteobacteria bacterium]
MHRLLKYIFAGSLAAVSAQAFAGGLPDPNAAAGTDGSNTSIDAASTEMTESGSTQTTVAQSAGTNNTAASGTNSQTTTQNDDLNNAGNVDQGEIEAGAFVAIEDDPLIIDASSVMDGDGVGSIQVQWQASSNGREWVNLTGEVRQSFTPREVHVGMRLRVELSYVDGQGNLETILSPSSSPVQNVNDKPIGSPQLVGLAQEEDALKVDTSMIADQDGLGQYSIIWQRSSTKTEWQAFPEAAGELLQLNQSHVGYSYRAVVSYVDSHGTKEILVTSPSEVVVNVDDPVQGEVVLSGEASEGQTIIASTSRISDEDGIASMSVGWQSSTDGRNWKSIETMGTTQLALTQALVNRQVRARVAVVDSFGIETVIFSQATNTVKNVNNKPAGTIFVRRVGD